MTIDFVNWLINDKKSILLQLEITGCKNATARFLSQVKNGMDWLMKESIISMMYVNPDFRDLNIQVECDEVYNYHFTVKDIKMDISFDIKFRAILIGVDNGNNILLNFVDFLEMLDEAEKNV